MSELLNKIAQVVTNCDPSQGTGACDTILPRVAADQASQVVLLQLVFGVLGALALFFVIYGGFKFVVSDGEPDKIAKARQTIIYAIIGLIIAISAEVIVTFTIGRI